MSYKIVTGSEGEVTLVVRKLLREGWQFVPGAFVMHIGSYGNTYTQAMFKPAALPPDSPPPTSDKGT